MAVYTDVAAEDLATFLAGYDLGELLSYKGIAEGVENSNFLRPHQHAATSSSRSTRSASRPATCRSSSALMEHLAARGITCPQPVKNRNGETLGKLCGRPAAIVTFLDGMWMRRPDAGALRRGRRGAGAHASRRRAISPASGATRSRSTAGGRCSSRRPTRADEVQPGLRATIERRARASRKALAARPAAGRDPRRPVSRQRVLPRRQAVGPDRLLFRLHRHARLRRRDLPQRLVLRARPFLQRHQGPRAAAPPTSGRGRSRDAELDALPLLARGAALRFLLTRLVDWLNVPPGALVQPKNPLEYFRKLRFHQKAASVRDYGLPAEGARA